MFSLQMIVICLDCFVTSFLAMTTHAYRSLRAAFSREPAKRNPEKAAYQSVAKTCHW